MSNRDDLTKGLVAAAIARGDSFARKGRYRRAIRIWRRLLEQESAEAQLAKELIRGKIGASYFRLSRLALRGKPTRQAWLKAAERLRLALKYENRPDYKIELARSYLKLGQPTKAAEALAELLRPADASEKALYYAAVAKIRLGDLEEAQRLIDRGRSIARGQCPGWWQRLAVICMALQGDVAQALNLVPAGYEGVPRSVWFDDVKWIARAAAPGREMFRALDAILDVLEEDESKAWASEISGMAGDVLSHLGQDEEAVRYWTDAADGETGHPQLDKVASTCEHRIVAAVKEGGLDTASRWYRIGVESGVEGAIKPLESVIYFYRAKEAWKRADYRAAAAGYSACLRWKPSFELARCLALAYEASGDWSDAASAWQRALRLAPASRPADRYEALRRQGLAWILAGEWEKAKGPLQRAFAVRPEPKVALYLGCVMIALGEYSAAASHLIQATGKNEEETPDLSVGVAAAVDLAGRSLEEKVSAWKRAARNTGELWVYRVWRRRLLDLGDAYFVEGRLDDALGCYVSWLIEDVDDRETWVRCGAVHLKEGRTDKAEKCFAEASRREESMEAAIQVTSRHEAVGGSSGKASLGRSVEYEKIEALIDAMRREPRDPSAALSGWRAQFEASSESDLRRTIVGWARRQLEIPGDLDPADVEWVLSREMPLPATSLPSLPEFGQKLPIQRLLAHEPPWAS